MKSCVFIICCLLLGGCSGFMVKPKFPILPDELKSNCPELIEISSKETKMTEFLNVININYSYYHECKLKVELFQKWYTEQQNIYENL